MKRIIGILMVCLPFIAIFTYEIMDVGIMKALLCFGIIIFLIAFLALAVKLIIDD